MPTPERGASGQGSDDLLYRRGRGRRKQTPARFSGGAAPQPPPHPPPQEHQHVPQQLQIEENPEADMNSDGSGTDPEEFDEVVAVSLAELRNNVQCPICLGIIKKARTVMGCLHRFCRECIDKSMRLGNNECPACRIHCASRRSLRDDLDFDTLVNSVYPDVEKYEQEELVLYEEEKAVNEQIRASIAQSFLRQTEAVAKARKMGRGKAASTSRVDRNCGKSYSRRSDQSFKFGDSNKNGNESDMEINALICENHSVFSQDTNEQCEGISPIRSPCIAVDEEDTEGIQRSMEYTRNSSSPANTNLLTWGRAGIRSQTRRVGANYSKATRSSRIDKLADHLANVEKNDHKHIAPVITKHVQSDEILWLKDYRLSGSNSSVSIDVLMSAPNVVERFNEFKMNALAPRISGS
ncbi:hypothetical protein C2S52_012950 [Perilla frutescens var. hirtella]|nr:hypothetical protein C2S51_015305 [Perilla frutescens var. frutescens]KAH6775389.1 hypothetical protein C2S52_012950 [Perilla frutescens var. hirtella]